MKLKELCKVLPAYTTVHVHDSKGKFAHKGNPHDFVIGLFMKLGETEVTTVVPLSPYTAEITVEECYNKEEI